MLVPVRVTPAQVALSLLCTRLNTLPAVILSSVVPLMAVLSSVTAVPELVAVTTSTPAYCKCIDPCAFIVSRPPPVYVHFFPCPVHVVCSPFIVYPAQAATSVAAQFEPSHVHAYVSVASSHADWSVRPAQLLVSVATQDSAAPEASAFM